MGIYPLIMVVFVLCPTWTEQCQGRQPLYIGFAWPGAGSEGPYRGVFYEKLLEDSSVSSRANPKRLQDRCATGRGWAGQKWRKPLCDNILKKKERKSDYADVIGTREEQGETV